MNKASDDHKPAVPPMEDPPLPDSYEPIPGEIPELPEETPQKDR